MSMILPIHVILSVLVLQALRITSLPEEAFYGYPLQAEEDYVFLDSRADPNYSGASAFKQSETHRRSILDKNFARFGRGGKILAPKDDADEDVASFGRNQRSGERSDQFIRFGRGKSDFVRFGRANGFLRFGRSIRGAKSAKTPKRAADAVERKKRSPDADVYKKGGSNFVRFGRDRNDNFMRFGRTTNVDSRARNVTGDWKKYLELQAQDGHDLVLKMLVDVLARTHVRDELQQLQQLETNLQDAQDGKQRNQSRNIKENYCRCN